MGEAPVLSAGAGSVETQWTRRALRARVIDECREAFVRLIGMLALLSLTMAGCQAPAPVAEPEPPTVVAPPPEPPPPPAPPPPPPEPVVTPSARALAAGVGLYDAGDFNGAIKSLLGAKDIWGDSISADALANKVAANKYLAFSYCVTNRKTQCRKHFVDALKLDTNFSLETTEKSHPVWGPEFERAKKQVSAAGAPAKKPASPPPPATKGTKAQ